MKTRGRLVVVVDGVERVYGNERQRKLICRSEDRGVLPHPSARVLPGKLDGLPSLRRK